MLNESKNTAVEIRKSLSEHRDALLSILDANQCDEMDLDDDRILKRVKIVSSKRISKTVLLAFIESYWNEYIIHLDRGTELIVLEQHMKDHLINEIDTVSYKGQILQKESKQAKRRPRDEPEEVRKVEIKDIPSSEQKKMITELAGSYDELIQQQYKIPKRKYKASHNAPVTRKKALYISKTKAYNLLERIGAFYINECEKGVSFNSVRCHLIALVDGAFE